MAGPDASFLDRMGYLILPSIVLGIVNSALILRFTRASMLDVLGEDYIRTARSKGMGEARVVLRHALKNAAIPIVTVVGLTFALLVSGAVVTERVFNIPGMGNLVVGAVLRRDYPVIQGTLIVVATLYILINLAIDLLYLADRQEGALLMAAMASPTCRRNPAPPSPRPDAAASSDDLGLLRARRVGADRHARLRPDPCWRRSWRRWIAPADPAKMSVRARLAPPFGTYLLGADAFGRDVASRLLYAGRVSLLIGLGTAARRHRRRHRHRPARRLLPPARRAARPADRRDDGLSRHPAGDRAGRDLRRLGRQRDPGAVDRLHAAHRPHRARRHAGDPRTALRRGRPRAGLVAASRS